MKSNDKLRTYANLAFHHNISSHLLDDVLTNTQSETSAAFVIAFVLIKPWEVLK